MEDGKYSGRGPAMRATYPVNRKRPQTQVKMGGRRVSMKVGVIVAWGEESGLPRARKDANSPRRRLVWGFVHSNTIVEHVLQAAFVHVFWLVRANPFSLRLSAPLALHFLPVVFQGIAPGWRGSHINF